MTRQYGNPYIFADGKTSPLRPVTGKFNEDWLQRFVFDSYQSIPIAQIEPVFSDLIPLCRELTTNAGPLDILFINKNGLLTLVECKLWKNPQARREVVGQILDYAKELSGWTYEELETRIGKTRKESGFSLFEFVKAETDDISEAEFIDNVTRNIQKGRFLLLILGDGIRENVEQIADYLQNHAHLNFSFALIEYGVFELPHVIPEQYFIQPRVLAQTLEVPRYVIRMDAPESPNPVPVVSSVIQTTSRRRMKISEIDFFEKLEASTQVKESLKNFFQKADELGLYLDPGEHSLMLKSRLFNFNFGVFHTDGQFNNKGHKQFGFENGDSGIGEAYLRKLALLFPNGCVVQKTADSFFWGVKIVEEGKQRLVQIPEILAVQDQWLLLIQETLTQLSEIE